VTDSITRLASAYAVDAFPEQHVAAAIRPCRLPPPMLTAVASVPVTAVPDRPRSVA